MQRTNPCPNESASQTGEDRLTPLLSDLRDYQIIPRLPYESLASLNLVSRAWFDFTNKADGIRLIARDAGIPMKKLTRFIELIKTIDPALSFSFVTIYHRLHRLLTHRSSDKKMLEDFYKHSGQHFALLACCLNSTSEKIILNFIPHDEVESWLKIAIMCGANKTVKQIIRAFNCSIDMKLINLIAEYGNDALLQELLEKFEDKRSRPDSQTLYHAIRSGNLKLVRYLCEQYPVLNRKLGMQALQAAARSGNCELLHYLLVEQKAFNCEPDDDVLTEAASSGDEATIRYLIKEYQIKAKEIAAQTIVITGNLVLIKELIEDGDLLLKPQALMMAALSSGEIELVRFLLNDLKLSKDLLDIDQAAKSGRIEIVSALVEEYGLIPSQRTLHAAIMSRNIELVAYLLKDENPFKLKIGLVELSAAIETGEMQLLEVILKQEGAHDVLHKAEHVLHSALCSGRFDMVAFVLSLAPTSDSYHQYTLSRSFVSCHPEVLRQFLFYLHQNKLGYVRPSSCDIINADLLAADQHFRRAMESLSQHDEFSAELALLFAAEKSRRHFFSLAVYTIEHAKEYGIGEKQVNCLLGVMNDVLARGIPSCVEREVIGQLFESATNEQIRAMKDRLHAFELSAAVCAMAKS